MPTSDIEELNASMSEIVRSEVAKPNGALPNGHDAHPANGHAANGHAANGHPTPSQVQVPPPPAAAAPREPVRLPRRIPGGFRGLTDDLDRRARDWRAIVRLMEQQRPQLEMAEIERDRLADALGRVVMEVQESGKSLKTMLDTTRSGDVSGDLAAQFTRQVGALEQLEDVTESLIANFILLRSTWEQYARSVIQAQGLRDELKPSAG
ncbi:hypothetical protein [Salinarimonas ramus]|uniref:Uncharacterized protein n=1 Tax=Salinarimonas ramus TaxID=690164 RepID=A0A917Q5S9_9HYPH|nr:hypothetical protein [Salinarimonas ramus]GGK27458.1 hypothetical protein GCM10011322_12520 [Salinarimonas ramus]